MSELERLEPVNPPNRLANERQDLMREGVSLLRELKELLSNAKDPDRMIESPNKPKNELKAWRAGQGG